MLKMNEIVRLYIPSFYIQGLKPVLNYSSNHVKEVIEKFRLPPSELQDIGLRSIDTLLENNHAVQRLHSQS
jgi:hypothetical protein